MEKINVALIFVGRKRPGFDPEWGARMAEGVRRTAGESEFATIEPPGNVVDDPSLREALTYCSSAGAEVLVLLQTTVGDGRLVSTVDQLWPDPIVLWATPEKQTGDMISSCSLVGLHAWASVLGQLGHPFEIVYGDPDPSDTRQRFSDSVRIAYTLRRLRLGRVGVIGGQAPGYFAMSADPLDVRQQLGPQVQMFTLTEFFDVVNSFTDDEVASDIAAFKQLGLPHCDTTDADLPMASRLYLAMRRYVESEKIDALAVRCWPEMPNVTGQWPYVGLARLAGEGVAVACEGDTDGALSAMVGECLGMGRCYLSDWLEHDEETITLWHGGNAPFCFSPAPGEPGGPKFARHFNNKKPGVVESTLKADRPVTIFRLWRTANGVCISSCDGWTIQPKRHLMGTNGLVRLEDRNPHEWFISLCRAGMPHHVAVFPGYHTALLRDFAATAGMQWIE